MYRILCDGKIFYHPLLKDYQITDGVCEMELNKAGTLTLTVPEENLHYSFPKLRTSIITLYDDDELLFRGVPYSPSRDLFLNSELTVVGELFFFNDSIQLPFQEFFGPVETLFRKAIEYHNTQVDSWKQFKVGKVTVKNDTASGDIVRSSDHAMNTWEFIQEKFLKPLGGYLHVRDEIDGIYIDYLSDLNYQGNQEVKQCINLIDAEEVVNSDELATVLVPYGARIKDSEGNETDERVTIESVNSGKLGVENAKAIETYGRITKTVTYDDITEPLNLKKAAERDLALSIVSKTLEVKAADLSKAAQDSDVKIQSFRVGHKVPVKIDRMGINQRMLIKHLTLDLFAPESTVLQIGNTAKDFTSMFTNFDKPPKPKDGKDGKNGTNGKPGPAGPQGPPGKDGADGQPGKDGDVGPQGPQGLQGLQGEKGEDGISLTSIDVEYAQSSSYTTAPTTGWQTTAPTWTSDKYIWTRNKTVLSNGTTNYSKAICVTGQAGQNGLDGKPGATGPQGPPGKDGATGQPGKDGSIGPQGPQGVPGKPGEKGQSITSITEEYYLSTSKTAQTGGSWATTPPTWESGKYIWTRSKLVYANPAKIEYTTPICSSEWEAANKVQENLEQVKTDFFSNIEQTEQSIIQTVSQAHYSKEETERLINSLSSTMTQNAAGFEMRFNQLKAEVDKANGTIVEQNKYIKFANGEIIIGIEGCPLVAVHTNKALEFRYKGAVVGKFTSEGLYTRNVNVENRINMFGKWSIGPGQNSNLNIKWIGGGK